MAQLEIWYKQDLHGAVKIHYLDGNVFSLDHHGNIVGVKLFDNGEPAIISGSVSANVIRSNNTTVPVSGILSENRAYVSLPEAACAIPGPISIIIKLTTNGVVTTVCAVIANVYASSTDTIVDPGTILPSIQTLLSEIETAVASIPADYSSLWKTFAPNFDTSSSYVEGQYTTYNGGLYRFIKNHSGEWSANDVVDATSGNEEVILKKLISDLNDWVSSEIGVINYLFSKGARIPTTTTVVDPDARVANAGAYCCVIECQEGDVFTWNLSGGTTSYRPWSFIDANNNVLSQATSNSSANTTKTAPQGSAKLVLNSTGSKTYCRKGTNRITTLENDVDKAERDIKHIVEGIANRFDKTKATEGYRLKLSDQSEVASASFGITDYVPCRTGDVVYRNWNVNSASYGDVFYDANKNAIGTATSTNNNPYIVIPEGCAYVRCTYALDQDDKLALYVLSPSDFAIRFATDLTLKESNNSREEELTALWSRGHAKEYRNHFNYGFVYNVENDEVKVKYIRASTRRVRVDSGKYVYVAFRASSLSDQTVTINFYNTHNTIAWDYLNDTNANGLKNTYTPQQLIQKNGGLFTNIPSGYYVEVVSTSEVSLIVWDGTSFGIPATPYSTIFFIDKNKVFNEKLILKRK